MNIRALVRSIFKRPPSVPSTQRREDFFLGANLPWITYGCDFGANAWHPHGGVSRAHQRQKLAHSFRDLSMADLRVVRWFMLCDGRAGLHFDGDNLSLDPFVFPDIDAAVETAGEFGIRIMFTLFDFYWFHAAQLERGVQAGGHGQFILDPMLRRRLLENVLQPILQRYGQHPAIHSWDIFNEPEWVIRSLGGRKSIAIGLRDFHGFVKDAAQLIHRETKHPATLGLARRSSLHFFDDCSLDFSQVHWYDKHGDHELQRPVKSQTPVVLGEFPTTGSLFHVAEILQRAHDAGFAGAMAWSARDAVSHSSFASFVAGLTEFRGQV